MMGKGTEWSDKAVREHWQVEVEGFSVGIAVRAGAGMHHSIASAVRAGSGMYHSIAIAVRAGAGMYHFIAIAVRAGAGMNLSVEIAEACWWLLLRSALCATPNYWPPALLLPLNRAGITAFDSYRLSARAAKRIRPRFYRHSRINSDLWLVRRFFIARQQAESPTG